MCSISGLFHDEVESCLHYLYQWHESMQATSHCLKITQNVSYEFLNFGFFSPIFVLWTLTCLVTLFEPKFFLNVEWDFLYDFQTLWTYQQQHFHVYFVCIWIHSVTYNSALFCFNYKLCALNNFSHGKSSNFSSELCFVTTFLGSNHQENCVLFFFVSHAK